MTFLSAYDGLSSDNIKHREECGAYLITNCWFFMTPDERVEVQRIYHHAWEQLHAKEQAA